MMVYLNPGGHNWGPQNYDGYAMSTVAVAVVYSIFFYLACFYIWFNRNHAALRMRKISLAILSLLILHVYLFMVFMGYWLNGSYPCSVEFWCMSIYLPIGIGLYQAQNQQLFILSKGQNELFHRQDKFKPLLPSRDVVGRPRYWMARSKVWWDSTSKQGKCEGFVFLGICLQFAVSLALYCSSRKFNRYGIISHPVSAGQCRRGWEWIPSIAWQVLWNYCFGPYLIWKVRDIHDVYHWRLQTIMAIVAALPGTPLWLVAVYSNSFTSINKYWIPVMWFVPGLVTIELTTLGFAFMQLRYYIRYARERNQVLADFENKCLNRSDAGATSSSGSFLTRSTDTKRSGRMYSTESLEECLNADYDGLQVYASTQELNGENIIFLVKVLSFKRQWESAFSHCTDVKRARATLYRSALSIFVSLIHTGTANYPINIESTLYNTLNSLFGEATELVASKRTDHAISTPSCVAPWDEPAADYISAEVQSGPESIHMVTILTTPSARGSTSNDSSEHIVSSKNSTGDSADPLARFHIPDNFSQSVFDEAYGKVRYTVWCTTWQRYMEGKCSSAVV